MRVLITCGPTWAAIDGVRVISNRSSGKLGYILAGDFSKTGADVTLLEGPVLKSRLPKTKKITVKKFYFYQELHDLLKKETKNKFDIIIHAAAVSDYKLKKSFRTKLKSGTKEIKLTLVPTEKIINKIRKWAPQSLLIGFKLELTPSRRALKAAAIHLMKEAGCDLVIANNVKRTYKAYIIDGDHNIIAQAASRAHLSKQLVKAVRKGVT